MDFIRPVYDTTVVVSEESLHHPDESKLLLFFQCICYFNSIIVLLWLI